MNYNKNKLNTEEYKYTNKNNRFRSNGSNVASILFLILIILYLVMGYIMYAEESVITEIESNSIAYAQESNTGRDGINGHGNTTDEYTSNTYNTKIYPLIPIDKCINIDLDNLYERDYDSDNRYRYVYEYVSKAVYLEVIHYGFKEDSVEYIKLEDPNGRSYYYKEDTHEILQYVKD